MSRSEKVRDFPSSTSDFRKGQWVRYDGIPRNQHFGQITTIRAGFVFVRFADGTEYGCYPSLVTVYTEREAAIGMAASALLGGDNGES